jgi:UDP-N-acetylmuramate--alanine ligase
MNIFNVSERKKSIGLIPLSKKIFHIIGIGGIGMSAIALVLHEHGLKIQGSDLNHSQNIERLKNSGIKCFIGGHKKENIENAEIIIYSSAIQENNEEISYAKKLGKTILTRSEILNYIIQTSYNILISGMHGKTTTSSIMALIFEHAKINQLAIIGGIMEFNHLNYIINKNFEWSVIEADESDDTFIKIPSTVSVITNISPEHLDYHLTFENIKRKFKTFIEKTPFFGFSVICGEDPKMLDFVSDVKKEFPSKKIFVYGIQDHVDQNENNIDYIVKNIIFHDLNKMSFDVYFQNKFLENFELNIFGKFNISNALACIAISHQIGISFEFVRNTLKNFKTTKRRFDIIGETIGGVLVIDDYAHHPKEINANIETAKILSMKRNGKLIVVIQPHRYSRVQKLFDSFIESKICQADLSFIMPIYASSEKEIKGVSSEILAEKIHDQIKKNNFTGGVQYIESFEDLTISLIKNISKIDLVIFMGAGDINQMAYDFFEKINI